MTTKQRRTLKSARDTFGWQHVESFIRNDDLTIIASVAGRVHVIRVTARGRTTHDTRGGTTT